MKKDAAPPVNPANDNDGKPGKACPICGKPMLFAYRPFCSKRCADVDLNRWFTGSYAVPATEQDEEEEEPGREV